MFYIRIEYFAVQYYGECWGGKKDGKTFASYGKSTECWSGVGKAHTNAVYRVEDMPGKTKQIKLHNIRSALNVSSITIIRGDQWLLILSSQYIQLSPCRHPNITDTPLHKRNHAEWKSIFSAHDDGHFDFVSHCFVTITAVVHKCPRIRTFSKMLFTMVMPESAYGYVWMRIFLFPYIYICIFYETFTDINVFRSLSTRTAPKVICLFVYLYIANALMKTIVIRSHL